MTVASTWLSGICIDLRPLSVEDAALTLRWRQAERARYLNSGAQSIEAQASWIRSRPSSEANFVIQLKDGTAVGMLSLVDIDMSNLRAETGRFLIGEEERVKGLPVAVEAMGLVYDLAFNTLGLRRLYGTIPVTNTLMIKWQKYLGMKEEGRLREHFRDADGFQDAVFLGITRVEYETIFIQRANVLMAAGRSS